jgi:hypothetical protein
MAGMSLNGLMLSSIVVLVADSLWWNAARFLGAFVLHNAMA